MRECECAELLFKGFAFSVKFAFASAIEAQTIERLRTEKKKQKNEMYVRAQLFSFALVPLSFCLSRAPKGAQISFDFFAHSMEKKTHTFDSFHL